MIDVRGRLGELGFTGLFISMFHAYLYLIKGFFPFYLVLSPAFNKIMFGRMYRQHTSIHCKRTEGERKDEKKGL